MHRVLLRSPGPTAFSIAMLQLRSRKLSAGQYFISFGMLPLKDTAANEQPFAEYDNVEEQTSNFMVTAESALKTGRWIRTHAIQSWRFRHAVAIWVQSPCHCKERW